VTPRIYLSAMVLEAATLSLLPIALLAGAHLIGGIPLRGAMLSGFGLLLPSLIGLGFLIALFARTPKMSAAVASTLFAIIGAFCPLLYAESRVPPVILPLVKYLPFTIATDWMAGSTSGWLPPLLLSGWGLALVVVSPKLLVRELEQS
jgi:hypothetical protein